MAKCFAIFEGGGAKGLAHVGALKAAEEKGLEFVGIAGASAGAIIAALIAAGYKADELYKPPSDNGPAQGLFANKNWVEFFDAPLWTKLKQLKGDLANIPPKKGSPSLGTCLRAREFWKKWKKEITEAAENQGFFSTQGFEEWLNEAVSGKLEQKGQKITFEQLHNANGTIPLKIVSVDIDKQELVPYSHWDSPRLPVARAVAASISIPFFFRPTHVGDRSMVDGGLMSNFPAWLFENERAEYPPSVRVYGFTLLEPAPNHASDQDPFAEAAEYATHVARTGIFGGQALSNTVVESLQTIPIHTKFGVLDFELDPTQKRELYEEGFKSAGDYFENNAVVDEENISAALKYFSEHLQSKLVAQPNCQLRANVMLPIGREQVSHLRVTYSYNMDTDADDRLLLAVSQTGAGWAFQSREAVYTKFGGVRRPDGSIPGLNKYDAALVPKHLSSIISVPVFGAAKEWEAMPKNRTQPIAVLCFDCSIDIISALDNDAPLRRDVEVLLRRWAMLVGRLLRGLPAEGVR